MTEWEEWRGVSQPVETVGKLVPTTQPKYVIAPEGCADYLTPGKKYEVRDWGDWCGSTHASFDITDDHSEVEFCLLFGCAHLNGGDWIVPEDDAETPHTDETDTKPATSALAGNTAPHETSTQSELNKDALIEDLAHRNRRMKAALMLLNGSRIAAGAVFGFILGFALGLYGPFGG